MEVKRQSLAVKFAKALYKSLSNRTGANEDKIVHHKVSCLVSRLNDLSMLSQTNDGYFS